MMNTGTIPGERCVAEYAVAILTALGLLTGKVQMQPS